MPRLDILAVAFLAALLTLPFIALTPFFTHGEAREALSPQSMLETHNWILPKRYGDETATKPPFMYWLVALFSLPRGEVTEFTARLPGALLSILATCTLFYFVGKAWDRRLAFSACLILMGSGNWLMETISARLDLTLSALLFMGFCAVYFWEERKLEGLPLLAILLFTTATLTKGPVAVALPALVLAGYLIILQYPWRTIALSLCKVFIPVTCLSAVWYGLAYLKGDEAFLHMVLSENLERLTSTMEKPTHVQTIWYLYGTLLVGLLPGSILFSFTLSDAARRLRGFSFDKLRAALGPLKSKNLGKMPKARLYSWLVVLCVLALFSVPSSKRPAYLLPLYPFVCIALAAAARKLVAQESIALRRLCISFLWLIVLLYGVLFAFLSGRLDPGIFLSREKSVIQFRFFEHAFSQSFRAMSILESGLLILPLALTVALIFRQWKGDRLGLGRLLAGTYGLYLLLLMAVNGFVLPTIGNSLSPKFYARFLAPAEESIEIYSFDDQLYELNFYLGNRLRLYRQGEKLPEPSYFLVAEDKHFGDFREAFERDYKIEVLRRSPADSVENPRPRTALIRLSRLRPIETGSHPFEPARSTPSASRR